MRARMNRNQILSVVELSQSDFGFRTVSQGTTRGKKTWSENHARGYLWGPFTFDQDQIFALAEKSMMPQTICLVCVRMKCKQEIHTK